MKTTRILSLATLAVVGAMGAAMAADALADRQAIFKSWGDDTRPIAGMLKGEAPFELAKVQTALKNYAATAGKLPALFPDNSKTGKTEASPKIWEEKAKFEPMFAKLEADAKAAQAAIVDEASFKANIGKVLGNCKACHDDYRIKK